MLDIRLKVFGGVGLGARTNAELGFTGGEGAFFPLKVLRFEFGGDPDVGVSIGDIFNTTFWSFSILFTCWEIVPVPGIIKNIV